MAPIRQLDVLVIGAGFAGFKCLHEIRSHGFDVKLFERQSASAGVWRQNRYPGARVDSDLPIYQFSDKSLYDDWNYSERFPGWKELQEYFDYVEEKWNLKKDIEYNRNVISAEWGELAHRWHVITEDGTEVSARWVITAIGFAARAYKPHIAGLEGFKGQYYHTAEWPEEEVDMKGKKVAVIGTGASGVQTIQEIGPVVEKLTVYQRTPNLTLPMGQVKVSKEIQDEMKADGTYEHIFNRIRTTTAAFTFELVPRNTLDDPPEVREKFFESLYANGGFAFWLGGYQDLFQNQEANDAAYDFWCRKARERIRDEKKADILAPKKPPHPFGTKRPVLEQRFYEVCNQDNVEIVDLQVDPILEVTETGIRSKEGKFEEFDIIVLATGFDAMTGGMTQMKFIGTDGKTMGERWKDGVYSYMGLSYHHYPNLFALYAPLGPTAFANGPTCVEIQGEWIADTIKECRRRGVTRLEPTRKAEEGWKRDTEAIWQTTLFPKAKSWYTGANIPGKLVEALNWFGGIGNYVDILWDSKKKNYAGFTQETSHIASRLFQRHEQAKMVDGNNGLFNGIHT